MTYLIKTSFVGVQSRYIHSYRFDFFLYLIAKYIISLLRKASINTKAKILNESIHYSMCACPVRCICTNCLTRKYSELQSL